MPRPCALGIWATQTDWVAADVQRGPEVIAGRRREMVPPFIHPIKNEKVAKGRIIGLAGPGFIFWLTNAVYKALQRCEDTSGKTNIR